jgi:threonine/homoserine efflux transporter RhtA
MLESLALVAAVVLPLWNVPLIVRVIRRRSSQDISMSWAIGVWVCLVLMAPSGFTSADRVWRAFNIVNFVLFTAVLITVLVYRRVRQPAADHG